MYLTFSWWILHCGWKVLKERVREAVEEVVGPCVISLFAECGAVKSFICGSLIYLPSLS